MKDLSAKFTKLPICVLLISLLATLALAGCSQSKEEAPDAPFSYSSGIDNRGFWEGVTATDFVELPENYNAIEVPKDTQTITDEALQAEIDSLLSSFSTANKIMDRAVVNGDTLNIDYVGSIGGVEFEGGNTAGAGSEVTIGTTSFIDDFLEQLVGHMPGETFNVEVTFPQEYNNGELAGKDAVFVVTINYISETVEPVLSNEFVATNLTGSYGWTTIDEMKNGLRVNLQRAATQDYIDTYITENSTVKSVPEKLMSYQEKGMINYYQQYADSYKMEFEEFMTTYLNASSTDELIENNLESLKETAGYTLIIQAIAEKQNIAPTDADVLNYFVKNVGTDDYSSYEEQYGMPYLKQITLTQMVLDHLINNAKIAS